MENILVKIRNSASHTLQNLYVAGKQSWRDCSDRDKKQAGGFQLWNQMDKHIYDHLAWTQADQRENYNLYTYAEDGSLLLRVLVSGTQGLRWQDNYLKSQYVNLPKAQVKDNLITVQWLYTSTLAER